MAEDHAITVNLVDTKMAIGKLHVWTVEVVNIKIIMLKLVAIYVQLASIKMGPAEALAYNVHLENFMIKMVEACLVKRVYLERIKMLILNPIAKIVNKVNTKTNLRRINAKIVTLANIQMLINKQVVSFVN